MTEVILRYGQALLFKATSLDEDELLGVEQHGNEFGWRDAAETGALGDGGPARQ
jgi:hypothetical protein